MGNKLLIMKSLKIIILSCILLAAITSCKKSTNGPEPDGSATPAPTGTFMLHIHTFVDTNEVEEYNTSYITAGGRKISLTLAQLYLSELELVKADGTVISFPGTRIFKVLDKETYMVGTAPVGNYKALRFKVGVNPDKQDPKNPADSSILNKSEMWFSNNPQQDGYIFMNVQGKIDTTINASATEAQMQPFTYKIGTVGNLVQVVMPEKNFTVLADQVEYGHIQVDYKQLFTGVKLYDPSYLSVSDVPGNATSTAAKIVSNIPSMFKYEE